ncbi:inosine-5-monophosphate dehydrogenase [Alphaproteobacteria bacterium 46_93_T64]|mgnify:CR=1 FL=1|nr:inosine-5-monophosphate dehydrogenase [Alphaproteobacteria bacterium 46_93_T64]
MNVASILKEKGGKIITASANDDITSIAGLLYDKKIGAILIVDSSGAVLGVLSERDIVSGLARHGVICMSQKAEDLMTKNVITCAPSDTIDQVMSLMTTKRIRHLPVIKDSGLVGFISIGDIVKYRMDEVEREAAAMRDYIATG